MASCAQRWRKRWLWLFLTMSCGMNSTTIFGRAGGQELPLDGAARVLKHDWLGSLNCKR
jgi:hypothetical protein